MYYILISSLLFSLWALTSPTLVQAQNEDSIAFEEESSDGIQVRVMGHNDDVLIRWAPADQGTWLQSLDGYIRIERYAFNSFANYLDGERMVLTERLSPWSLEEFADKVDDLPDDHPYVMAGHLVHGEWETIDTNQVKLDMQTIIQRYEETKQRYSMSLVVADLYPEAADAMGWRFVDENIPDSNFLSYHLILYINGYPMYQNTALYRKDFQIKATPNIEWTEEMEASVKLSWDRESHEQYFTGYFIERSADGVNFERLNTLPFIYGIDERETFGRPDIHYTIEAENNIPFYYRVIGINFFGIESDPSNVVKLVARDLTPPPTPDRVKSYMPNDEYMLIEWEQDSVAVDLFGYIVKKSNNTDSELKLISDVLSPESRYFIDPHPDPLNDNFYQVCAVDSLMNEACTQLQYGFIQDTFPPAKPVGLRGEIDSRGIVTLQWDLGPEPDIMGYNVYFSNRYNGVFSIITNEPVRNITYRDTINLNSLTKEVFYRISAVDVRGNASDFSDMVMVMRPDTIPPGPAIFTNYEVSEAGIYLAWAPSSSRDVVGHHLYRKKEDGEFELRKEITLSEENFLVDSMVEGFTLYTYKIIAIDDSNLRSQSVEELNLRTKNMEIAPDLILNIHHEEGAIFINYQIENREVTLKRVILYKSINNGPFLTWRTVENPDFETLEDRINNSQSFSYKAMAITESGLKTNFSQEKRINYEME